MALVNIVLLPMPVTIALPLAAAVAARTIGAVVHRNFVIGTFAPDSP